MSSEQTTEIAPDCTCPTPTRPTGREPEQLPPFTCLTCGGYACEYAHPGRTRCPESICDCFISTHPDSPRDLHPEVYVVTWPDDPTTEIAPASIDDLAHEISDLLNASYAPDADRELILWRRLTKVSEEAGEVQDALRGWVGENPRKGVTHTRSDVITELLDCAGAALGGVAHLLTDDEPAIADLLRERLEYVATRLRPTKEADRG